MGQVNSILRYDNGEMDDTERAEFLSIIRERLESFPEYVGDVEQAVREGLLPPLEEPSTTVSSSNTAFVRGA